METYKECYIAYLDILGFKNIISNFLCDEVFEIFTKNLKKPMDGFSKNGKQVINMNDIRIKVMSDSVCFYVDAEIKNALVGLIATCLYFQVGLLRREQPILLRGAITKGNLYSDENVIFGPGYVSAYLMEENNAKYPRIIMTKSLIDEAAILTEEEFMDYIPRCVFCDFDELYTVDYLEVFEGFDTSCNECPKLLGYLDSVLHSTLDNSIRDKFLYVKHRLLRWYDPNNPNMAIDD